MVPRFRRGEYRLASCQGSFGERPRSITAKGAHGLRPRREACVRAELRKHDGKKRGIVAAPSGFHERVDI